MATMITEECINCGACEPECPNQAISSLEDFLVIDPTLCTECVGFHDAEACAAVCPVDCCVADPNNLEQETILVARAREIHPEANIGEDFPSRFRLGAEPATAAPSPDKPAPATKDAAAGKPAAAKPAGSPPASKMISPKLKALLEKNLASGDPLTIQLKKMAFTGRVFRLMLDEGWIALENDDGRRKGCYLITGGKITTMTGEEMSLPG